MWVRSEVCKSIVDKGDCWVVLCYLSVVVKVSIQTHHTTEYRKWHDCLSPLLTFCSHSQVQFRLKQIVDASPDQKEALLTQLEEFANRGIPDIRNPTNVCLPVSVFVVIVNDICHEHGKIYNCDNFMNMEPMLNNKKRGQCGKDVSELISSQLSLKEWFS